jgi:hypothetical protein
MCVMEPKPPQHVLRSLLGGVDPATGEVLAPVPLLQQPEVQRALLAAIGALESESSRTQRRASLPGNIGQPWTQGEEQQLAAAFKSGQALADIASRHGRSLTAIEARLERLGLLAPEQRVTRNRYSSNRVNT